MIFVKEQECKDTIGVIWQHNDQTIKNKITNNDTQNITYKTKDRVTQRKVTFIYCENNIYLVNTSYLLT